MCISSGCSRELFQGIGATMGWLAKPLRRLGSIQNFGKIRFYRVNFYTKFQISIKNYNSVGCSREVTICWLIFAIFSNFSPSIILLPAGANAISACIGYFINYD